MPEIKVFRAVDGRITIRWSKGQAPDRPTLERLYGAISGQKKSPSTNGNSQKGSAENGAVVGHSDITTSAAESQEIEELFRQLTEEEQQAALKRMRDIKEGRA